MERLEQRMYGLVPYNISPIQQGIQYGHAVVEYGLKNFHNQNYLDWAKYDKTFIILNGGTTNKRASIVTGEYAGSLNNHVVSLENAGVNFATFEEPDLGDQLTAVVFLVDERVFNREKYPDFFDYVKWKVRGYDFSKYSTFDQYVKSLIEERDPMYTDWVKEVIGGETNEFLRNFLRNFRLA